MKFHKILIIGGTGALGKSLLERWNEGNDIVVMSRDEHKQTDLIKKYPDHDFVLGDVRDKEAIVKVLNDYTPDIIINAAALKHVPVCESNPLESVKTNILGHTNLIEAIKMVNYTPESLIYISTDKACKPINVYGMCKAISERIYLDYARQQKDTQVVLCRYGNVVDSTGSVIPYFKKLIEGGVTELPLTDERMTRFLISLPAAVDLIEWAYGNRHTHGTVVIPKLKSIRIKDLVTVLGDCYNKDLTYKVIGIRPGEKLHEEMISLEEGDRVIDANQYLIINDKNPSLSPDWQGRSYSSETDYMNESELYDFLTETGVV